MEILFILIKLTVLTFGLTDYLLSAPDPCGFADATAIITYDHEADQHLAARNVTTADRLALRRIDGIYDWLGYEQGGFGRPALERLPIEVQVLLRTGETRHIYFYDDFNDETNIQWVWAFRSLTQSTDANGEHFGLHDICASGGWNYDAVAALLSTSLDTTTLAQSH